LSITFLFKRSPKMKAAAAGMPFVFAGIGLDHRHDDEVECNLSGLDEFAGELEGGIRITQFSLLVAGVAPDAWAHLCGSPRPGSGPRNSLNGLHVFVSCPVARSLPESSGRIDAGGAASR
jgi:hypothetical protein